MRLFTTYFKLFFFFTESQAPPTLEFLSVRPQADSLKITWRPVQSANTVVRGYRVAITNGVGGKIIDSAQLLGESNRELVQYNHIGKSYQMLPLW